jgi:hypothetical protein
VAVLAGPVLAAQVRVLLGSTRSSAGTWPAVREEHNMTEFIFAYRSPTGYTPDDPEVGAAWRAWFAGFGPAIRDIGRPVVDPVTVGTTSGDGTHLGGYSVVSAEGLDDALAMAKGCPLVSIGGGVEVGTLVNVPEGLPAS